MNFTRFIQVITLLLLTSTSAVFADSLQNSLCKELRKLDWAQKKIWKTQTDSKTPENIDDSPAIGAFEINNFSIAFARIEQLVKPYKISGKLKKALEELDSYSFSYFHVKESNLYYFGNVQGSARCNYDVWAEQVGNEIREIDNSPFGNDNACGVNIYFGTYLHQPIIIGYQLEQPATLKWIATSVKIAFADKEKWGKTCVIGISKNKQ